MFRDKIINLTTVLLIPCFVAIETDFKWLENMVFLLMQLFLLTTGAPENYISHFFSGDRTWFTPLDPSSIEGFLFSWGLIQFPAVLTDTLWVQNGIDHHCAWQFIGGYLTSPYSSSDDCLLHRAVTRTKEYDNFQFICWLVSGAALWIHVLLDSILSLHWDIYLQQLKSRRDNKSRTPASFTKQQDAEQNLNLLTCAYMGIWDREAIICLVCALAGCSGTVRLMFWAHSSALPFPACMTWVTVWLLSSFIQWQ